MKKRMHNMAETMSTMGNTDSRPLRRQKRGIHNATVFTMVKKRFHYAVVIRLVIRTSGSNHCEPSFSGCEYSAPPKVLNVVALQTRGMISKKMLTHIKHNLIIGPLPGAVLFIYPHIPSGGCAAKRTVTGSGLELAAATGTSEAATGASDESASSSSHDRRRVGLWRQG